MHRTLEFARELQKAVARDNLEQWQPELADLLYDSLKYQDEGEVRIRSQRIGQFGASFLARKLRDQQISVLDLYNNQIGQDGVAQLLKLNIQRMNLGGNNLAEIKPLVEFLGNQQTNLEVLELGNPNGFSFPVYNGRKQPKPVQPNHLQEFAVSEIIKILGQNRHLKYIGLSGNDLSPASHLFAGLFKQNRTLSAVDFSNCNLGNRGVATLLRSLLESNCVTYLNICGNNFTMLVANLVATLLQTSPNLAYLNISNNPLGAEGARCLSCGLAVNRSLQQLEMQNCAFGDQGICLICSVLSKDVCINEQRVLSGEMSFFDEIQQIFDQVGADVAQEKKITLLDYTGQPLQHVQLERRSRPDFRYDKSARARSGTKHFRVRQTSVERLIDSRVDSPAPGFEQNENQNAKSACDSPFATLDTADCSLANNCQETPLLDTNIMNTQRYGSPEAFEGSGIAFLNISNNALTSSSFVYVAEMLRRGCNPLRRLNLSGSRISLACCKQLAGALLGEEISFDKDDFMRFHLKYQHVSHLSLTHLSLANCTITDEGFLHLCIAFARLPELICVDLSDNFVSYKGEHGLLILLSHPSLMRFSMRGNQISHSCYTKLLSSMQANQQKIALNGPRVLENKIWNLRRETQRLPHDREELEFQQKTNRLIQSYCDQIMAQKDDAEDVSMRQCQNVHQRIDAMTQEIAKVQAGIEDFVQQQKRLSERVLSNQQLIQQAIKAAETEHQEAADKLQALHDSRQLARTQRSQRLVQLRQELQQATFDSEQISINIKTAQERKQAILLRDKFASLAGRAFNSTSAGKIAMLGEYELLLPVLRRSEVMLEMRPIPKPFGYDMGMVALTRLRKRKKGSRKAKQ